MTRRSRLRPQAARLTRRTGARALLCLALLPALLGAGCAARPRPGPAAVRAPAAAPAAPTEAAPAADLFGAAALASLFSYPKRLERAPLALGSEWSDSGTVVWALSFTSPDDTFAPVTLVLFEGRYRGLKLDANRKALLRTSDDYHDLEFGDGRAGFAMRAGSGSTSAALETAAIPSPRGRYELLVVIDVPSGGPREVKGTEAYRALLMGYPVKLIESVARGLDQMWMGRAHAR